MYARFVGFVLGLAMAATAPAKAQQQQRDPLGGQFGAMEVALPPAEAARQVEMMAQAFAGLQPQRPGVVDTYVLSAGLWNDPVFEQEASQAAAILSRRFDAEGRTLVLSAGTGGATRAYPAASPNNIQAAIGKIGATINPNEDLVVVFLTSHGGPDGAIALQERNRMGGALRAQHLRQALNAAGIKRRVVIVSACFSGHFIVPFSDPNSVVLTAAAADRTSFGCEPENNWTYFGDALFNRSLRAGADLVSAFNASLDLITKWEGDLQAKWDALPPAQKAKSERPVPSNPQSYVGELIAPVVAAAQAYGLAVDCSGTLSFALDRARSSRPLKGAPEIAAIEAARTRQQAEAARLGAIAKRTPAEISKGIAVANASALAASGVQLDSLGAQAQQCVKSD
jgi:hypothetical protein